MGDQLYTIKEVKTILKVSQATVYRMVAEGRLPHIRIGKLVRIPAAVVDEMLKKGIDPAPSTQDQEQEK